MKAVHTIGIFSAITVLAGALRLPALDLRPMHADEAVHAAKMGRLIEEGRYEYDPHEFHGPVLNYLTLVPARASGATRYAELDEVILRRVPALSGVLLVAAHILLVPAIGVGSAAAAALLTAVSPAMVYYSRDYIQETLLVTFTFGALLSLCRYLQRPHAGWAVAVGASIGLMYATKETWVIAVGAMVVSWFLARHWTRSRPPASRWSSVHLVIAGLAAVVVSVLFFTSFFSHPRGVVDSVLAYRTYLTRASGASWHVYPWHYYFGLLLFTRSHGAPIWTEALIVGLAFVGLIGIVRRAAVAGADGKILVLIAIYSTLMVTAYAVIPYKTPWCVLSFLHGLILLAGVGAVHLLTAIRHALARGLVFTALVGAAAHLGWQAWEASYRFAADPRNPYVYAQTGAGVFDIARRIDALAQAHPLRREMPIEVISGENLWPLPWYLRRHSDVRWETSPAREAGNAPVILATPEMEREVARKLYDWRPPGQRELYVPIFDVAVELRPQVEIRGYAAKTLWDDYQRVAADSTRPAHASR